MKQYFIFYVMYSDIVCFVLFCSVSLKSCWLDLMNGLRTQLENRWIDRFVLNVIKDFPGSSAGEESTCQRRRRKKCGFDPCVRKIPWKRAWQLIPVFLPGEPPRTEEPGRLQSMGSQKVGHHWAANTFTTHHSHSLFQKHLMLKLFIVPCTCG